MESPDIIFERAEMAARKNGYYVELINKLTPEEILPEGNG